MAELPRPTAPGFRRRMPHLRYVAQVLSGVVAMPERVLELAVPIAPRTCPRTVMRASIVRPNAARMKEVA